MHKNIKLTKQDQSQTQPNIKDYQDVKSFMKSFTIWQKNLAISAYIEGIFTKETLIGKLNEFGYDNFKVIKALKVIDIAKDQWEKETNNKTLINKERLGTTRITRDNIHKEQTKQQLCYL